MASAGNDTLLSGCAQFRSQASAALGLTCSAGRAGGFSKSLRPRFDMSRARVCSACVPARVRAARQGKRGGGGCTPAHSRGAASARDHRGSEADPLLAGPLPFVSQESRGNSCAGTAAREASSVSDRRISESSPEQTLAEQADHQLSSRGRAPQLNAAEGQLQHRARLSAGGRRGMPAGGAKQPGQRASRGGRVNSSGQCPGVQGASPAVRQSPQSSPHCAVGRGRRRRRKPNLWCAQTACSSMR